MPTLSSAEILRRSEELKARLSPCELCPRQCHARRLEGQTGYCQMTDRAVVSSILPHYGEEPPISGSHGSGTVFLSGCNAGCIFCQNYQISQLRLGQKISAEKLAREFLKLQQTGCHNINWVTPTPHLPFLTEALAFAVDRGLTIPVVYNTNGYDRLEILQMLDGIVDIYLPDMKYGADVWAEEFSELPNYSEISAIAVREMYRQVGILQLDERQIARRGLLIRHLVLPEGTAGSRRVFEKIAAIDPQIPVGIMAQYHPCYQAINHPILGRRITAAEYRHALELFEEIGLETAYLQDVDGLEKEDPYFPDFRQPKRNIFGI